MKLPMVHSGVVDVILAAMQAGGYILHSTDVDKIRNASASLTEADRDDLANDIEYGGGGSKLVSATDAYVFIDSDASPLSAHFNFFRVIRSQDTAPISSWKNPLFHIYFNTGIEGTNFYFADAIVGVDTNTIRSAPTTTAYCNGKLYLGGRKISATEATAYGRIEGGKGAIHSVTFSQKNGVSIRSSECVDICCGKLTDDIAFWCDTNPLLNADDPTVVPAVQATKIAGFSYNDVYGNLPMFHLDAYDKTTNTDALLIARFQDKALGLGYFHGYNFCLNRNATKRWINFTTNETNFESYYTFNGTQTDVSYERHPAYKVTGVPDTSGGTVVAIYGAAGTTSRDVLQLKAFKDTTGTYNATILRLRSADDNISTYHFNYIQTERWDGFIWRPTFRITNQGDVYAHGTFNSSSLPDLAESIVTDVKFEPGDVLVMLPSGAFAKSDAVACSNVMGVVAEKPGVLLGGNIEEATKRLPLTVCGFVPVKCLTTAGDIIPGDRLVSAPDGCAQKAVEPIQPGTLIGKAMAPLAKENGQDVTGKILVFVNLQ